MERINYDFELRGKNFSGELRRVTGQYAGGQVETSTTTSTRNGRTETSTSQSQTINIRTADGKVKSVIKDGTANIPGGDISLFYYPKGEYVYPFSFYVHDTEVLYSLGKKERKGARRALSGWNPMRRLWARLIDTITIGLTLVGSAVLAYVLAEQLDWGVIGGISGFIAGLFLCLLALVYPNKWLGGSLLTYDELEKELDKICFAEAESAQKSVPEQIDLAEYGITDGPAPASTKAAEPDFKPMF